jgi:general secretion pathway protein E
MSVYQFPPQVADRRGQPPEEPGPDECRRKAQTPGRPDQNQNCRQGAEVELRLATLPTAFGEKMVLRIFDPQVLLKSFDQLGLSPEDMQRWQQMTTSAPTALS